MNNRDTLKKLLVEFREEGLPEPVFERETVIDEKINKANMITGIRRSGKTYKLYRKIQEKGVENCFYINMEDERLLQPTVEDLSEIIPVIEETFETSKPINLFIDEIQNIENWEKWARRISEDEDVFLYITGSSSKLSSRGISTALRGRTLTTYNFPLNFREYLDFNEVDIPENVQHSRKRHGLKRHFEQFLKFGGMPEVVLSENERIKRKILQEYFNTIITRDIIERNKVRNTQKLENFIKLLLNHFSRMISFSKTRNWLKSLGIKTTKKTLIEYFDYIKKSYFMFDVKIFSSSVKDRLQYPRKVYVVDNGFPTAVSDSFSEDRGWYFENLVALELYKETVENPSKDIHYWKDRKGNEVDFVLKKGDKVEKLVQVCADLNQDNRNRELDNLIKASEDLGCEKLHIVTGNSKGKIEHRGKTVEATPLWLWSLKN